MFKYFSGLIFLSFFSSFQSFAEVYVLSCFTNHEEVKSKELQAFFDQGNKDHYPTFDLSGKVMVLDKVVRIAKIHDRTVRILGNNALIKCEGGWIESGDTKGMIISNGRGAHDIMSNFDTYRISDIHFKSKGSELALRLVGTYQSELSRCTFEDFSSSVDIVFCMQMLIEHCEFKEAEYGLVIRSGMSLPEKNQLHPKWFENASVFNSCSNRTQVRDCRFYSKMNSHTLLRVDASDGVCVENCIFEGFNPVYAIYADHRNSSTVPSFYVKRPHLEFVQLPDKKTEALIHATASVIVHIEGMYSQFGNCPQIEAKALQVVVERPAYLPLSIGTGLKSMGSSRWKFIDPWNTYSEFFEVERWVDGIMPEQVIVEQHNNIYSHGVGIALHELKGGTQISQGQGRIKLLAKDQIFLDGNSLFLQGNLLKTDGEGKSYLKIFDNNSKKDLRLKLD